MTDSKSRAGDPPTKATESEGASLTRHASLRWLTGPPQGVGSLGVASRAFTALPISLTEGDPNPQQTTPSEMLSAALSGYFGTYIAHRLANDGHPARELTVYIDLSVSPAPEYALQEIRSKVGVRAEGLDQDTCRVIVEKAVRAAALAAGLRDDIALVLETTAH